MNNPIKVLFDENFGEPLVSALAKFLQWHNEPIDICHLFKFAKQSEPDEVWVPKIKADGWMVITTDRGKRCGGKKLPDICCKNEVTHVLLSSSLHEAKQFEKMRAVLAVLPDILEATKSPKGSRFSLKYDGSDKRVILTEWPVKAFSETGVPLPRLGFSGRQKRVRGFVRQRRKKKSSLEPTLWPEQNGK